VSMIGLAVGAGILLSVIFPRLKGSRRGILFFNAIAEYDSSKLQHCYDLSKVCSAKYRIAATALLFLLLLSKSSSP
jgi:hypothetical protein